MWRFQTKNTNKIQLLVRAWPRERYEYESFAHGERCRTDTAHPTRSHTVLLPSQRTPTTSNASGTTATCDYLAAMLAVVTTWMSNAAFPQAPVGIQDTVTIQ